MNDKFDEHLGEIDEGRRDVLRKLILGAAFVAPTAATFGLGPANAQVPSCLLSNSFGFAEGPGESAFGYTQNRDNCRARELPDGLDTDPAFGRFPRKGQTFDHGKD